MMTDPIADFLTRLRNGHMAKHKAINCPSSKLKVRLAQILKDEGYITDFSVEKKGGSYDLLNVTLRYDEREQPVIEGVLRISKPGLRRYTRANDLPKIRGGLGMSIISTSKGVMTDHQARKDGVGGEILCTIW